MAIDHPIDGSADSSDFARKPTAGHPAIRSTTSSLARAEIRITAAASAGSFPTRLRARSRPLWSPREMSTRTTSGRSLFASASSSAPVEATPAIVGPCRSSSVRAATRNDALSSTISRRMGTQSLSQRPDHRAAWLAGMHPTLMNGFLIVKQEASADRACRRGAPRRSPPLLQEMAYRPHGAWDRCGTRRGRDDGFRGLQSCRRLDLWRVSSRVGRYTLPRR
jgi:hypothetical protein